MGYRCPCCGNYTLDDPPNGNYEICPVCYWEDAPLASKNMDEECACNGVSLNQARRNYAAFGACSLYMKKHVRRPTEQEKGREWISALYPFAETLTKKLRLSLHQGKYSR